MKLQTTRPFDRDYAGLPEEMKERVEKRLALLLFNPRHPSPRLKRIRGTAGIWEVRVSRSYRLTLQLAGDTYLLRRVGPQVDPIDVIERP